MLCGPLCWPVPHPCNKPITRFTLYDIIVQFVSFTISIKYCTKNSVFFIVKTSGKVSECEFYWMQFLSEISKTVFENEMKLA